MQNCIVAHLNLFDIVDTITIQEIEEEALSLKEVLLKAIQD